MPADRRSTLVFAANIAHVHSLCAKFHEHGIEVRSVSSKTKQAEREEIYRAFKAGEFPVLVNCEILTEGGAFFVSSWATFDMADVRTPALPRAQPTFPRSTASSLHARRGPRSSSSR